MNKFIVLVLCIFLVRAQDKPKHNITFDEAVQLSLGILKSLNVTDDADSIKNCMASGISFTELAKYNWTQLGRLDKNKIP